MQDLKQALYLIADEMRAMATLHKKYAENVYHAEQADHLMHLAAKVASLVDENNLEIIETVFNAEPLLHFSPVIGTDAAIFNSDGEILLIQRRDNGRWALPGGLAEIGQSMSEAALRELWEEAGLRGRAIRLLGVFDGRLWASQEKVHMIHFVFLIECDELTPTPGIEALDTRFFSQDALPVDMHAGHERRVPKCFELFNQQAAYFDPSDSITTAMAMHQRL